MPLKFHKQFLVYIKMYSELYVPYFVTRFSCSSRFVPLINMSILFCTYQLVSREMSVREVAFERVNV
jgi:hypothetical protein